MKEGTENEQLKPVETQSLIPVDPTSLKTDDTFKDLFSIDTETYKQTYSKVYLNMDLLGFDQTQPIIVWKDKKLVIDGHTRLKVALEKEIKKVWVIEKDFINEDDAIQYVIHLHRDRRKFTDADIFRLVCKLDDKHPPGRPRKTASPDAVFNSPNQLRGNALIYYVYEMAGITHSKKVPEKFLQEYCPNIPYPNDFPKTDLNLALHKRIPDGEHFSTVRELTIPGRNGGKLHFNGDIVEGLRQFSEWAYGRSDDITATLIGTSRAKVGKCRRIRYCKKKDLREDLWDKVLRGKLTINRASSIVKNNGERGNGKKHKLTFQKGVEVHLRNQSIDSDSVKWVILGTHGKPPEINEPIPKNSIICPKE
jgi:hypothetical protein